MADFVKELEAWSNKFIYSNNVTIQLQEYLAFTEMGSHIYLSVDMMNRY